uniref:Coiled-coil domain-containing protein 86 n=1 Tax=Favella ehrenbergii TaxID=182087 RepID=A0A7S3I002_9SPIT
MVKAKKTKKAAETVVKEVVEKKPEKKEPKKQEPKKEEEKPAEVEDFKGVVTLGTNSQKATIGRNKSGKPWKKESSRSSFNKGPSIAFKRSIEERQRLMRIREIETRLRDNRKNSKQEARRKQREKAERKKINEFKSSTYQTISSLAKTRMWSRKAKQTLAKMPAELFYQKYK